MSTNIGIGLAIVGYRNFNDYTKFVKHVDEYIKAINKPIDCIISGGCRGADTLAEKFASERKIKMMVLHPDWKTYPPPGYKAYIMRDQQIAAKCDFMIAFPSDAGKGTQHTIKFAQSLNKDTKVIHV
jgi:hypothetical protein